jgi:hypothetical protein
MLLITRSPPLCSGSWTIACSLSSISSLTPADQPCLLPILSISSLPLAIADRRALIFVPVRSSSPSLVDLIRPLPLASTRHTRGRNSGDLSCSSIRAFSSALSSGLLPASSLASRPHGDWEWYNSLASLGGTLPPLPAGCAGTAGVASLALTARGYELPLCEPRPQALFSAIFLSVGPFCRSSERVSLNPSEFNCPLSSLPTVSPLFPR